MDTLYSVLITILFMIALAAIRFRLRIWKYLKAHKNKTQVASAGQSPLNRRKALIDWAQSKGLNYNPSAGVVIAGRYWHLSCLQKGEGHFASNVMEGTVNNLKTCAFDYHYERVSTDKNGNRTVVTHYYFSAVVVETSASFKPLFIRTENVLDRIAESVGLNDIDFESEEFNKTFYVKSTDKKWAYEIINQATMELLLNHCRFNIEFNGKYVIAYRDELFELGHFEEALQLLIGIIDNLPQPLFGKEKGYF